jgi:hypothetical protein
MGRAARRGGKRQGTVRYSETNSRAQAAAAATGLIMRTTLTLDEAVREIHSEFAKVLDGDKKAYRARIAAGQLLIALRKRIEAGEAGAGVNWWEWYASKFVRSRKDGEKVMRLAAADDPEAAAEEERAETRERVAAHREAERTVRSKNSTNKEQAALTAPTVEAIKADIKARILKVLGLSDATLARIDAWSARQDDTPDRLAAICRLVEIALNATEPRGTSKPAGERAMPPPVAPIPTLSPAERWPDYPEMPAGQVRAPKPTTH